MVPIMVNFTEGSYWGGTLIREGCLFSIILPFGGEALQSRKLTREWARIRSFMVCLKCFMPLSIFIYLSSHIDLWKTNEMVNLAYCSE